ncbi:MAG TPA: choice-of-anchor B family protein [Gemmatimonadales bacterium]|nr:choice-of-anchor B family protein [Gemmatimonadales bacterium]
MPHRNPWLLAVAIAVTPFALSAQGAFGSGLAITAGGREVLVGQPGNAYGPGVVYIYTQNAKGAWTVSKKLTRSGATNGDGFGVAVAVDGNTLLVGSQKADSEVGAVYVFTRDASGWKEAGRLTPKNGQAGDGFGSSILLVGDRAYVSTSSNGRHGAVFIFHRTGQTWAAETMLTPAAPDTLNPTFGQAVAASGSRLMIGALRADSGTGAVFVYTRDASGKWTLESRMSPPGPMTGRASSFGSAIILRGDTAIIGALNDRAAGAVWFYNRDSASGQWNPVSRVLPFDGSFGSRFGSSIAEVGKELWVGAVGANQFQGRVYRFTRDSTGFPTASKFGPTTLLDGDRFGGQIVASGSLIAIAIGNEDYGEGGVALYSRSSNGTWQQSGHLVGEVSSLPAITGAQRECTSGKVQIFDCHQVDLMSFLPVSAIGGKRGVQLSDIWGYTDAQTGREYALVGRVDGTAFVDISDPTKPVYLGDLPKTAGSPGTFWREIKTYKHYAYIVSDAARDHGMQIFDLNRLRGVKTPQTFTEDAHYSQAHSVHDIVADTASGFIYLTGSNAGGEMCGGGLHMVDVREPLKPKFAGCFADPQTGRQGTGYTHDAECLVYHGPSAKYQGRQICFGWNETHLSIADVTDKAHPVAISRATYPNVGYAHQGWLTDDQRYAYEDDELDEIEGLVDGTRTLIWDLSDLENPVLAGQYISKNKATDHNLWLVGNTMYQSNYVSGLRVLDITDRLHPKEIGFFDTHPVGPDEPGFEGTWGNYPFFKSGVVAVSSMTEGLFILKARPGTPVP